MFTDFAAAELEKADFSGAKIIEADFSGANLSLSHLTEPFLRIVF